MKKGKTDRSKIARNNRQKGHHSERYYAEVFRELGFRFCKTSRLASRMLDNCKIDLSFLPFNVQIKGGVHKGLAPGKVLNKMQGLIKEKFPPFDPVHENPSILIHRKKVYSKGNDDDLVYMSQKQHGNFTVEINQHITILLEKTGKEELGEYSRMVAISFKDFKNYVIPYYLNVMG